MGIYDPKAIREEINSLLDRAHALSELAKQEEREPTADEQAEFNAIITKVGDNGDKPSGLYEDLATAEKFQNLLNRPRLPDSPSPVNVGGYHVANSNEPFKLPRAVAARNPRSLKVFGVGTSENPIHDAYACGRWFMAISGDIGSRQWCEENGVGIQAAMTEGDNSKGGFFVPTEMSSRIIDLRYQYGLGRQHADIEPMMSDEKTITRRKSGVTAYAVGEGDAFTASDMTVNQVSLVAKKWGVLTQVSDELVEDSIVDVVEKLVDEAAWAFAKKEDESLFVGDGTSTYHGISGLVTKANDGSHAGAIYTAATGNTAFSTLDLADFEGMLGQLPSWADDGAAWYVHKTGWAQSMLRLQMAAGGNTTADIGNGAELQFLGKPVRFTPVMNSTVSAQTSTAGLAILANLKQSSTIGNRSGSMSMKVLQELYAANGNLGVRCHTRAAINNHSITDPEDATGATAGPVIVLKTPAS